LNNACSVEIQRGTDKELNQELAGKSQFLVARWVADFGNGRHKQKRRTTQSEWLAVSAVCSEAEASGHAGETLRAFGFAAQGIQ